MIIERRGRHWKLTDAELLEAYQEQQAIYDRQDITDNLSWILDGCPDCKHSEIDLKENQKFIALAANYSRDMQNSEDMSFTVAMTEGVKKAISEMEESGEL